MISIFGEKMAFFSKTNDTINFLHNLALFIIKNANFFANFFRRKYLKDHRTQVIDLGDTLSYKEPSEEVRLVLVRIVSKLIEKSVLPSDKKGGEAEHLKLHADDALSILRSTLSDNFADVKEARDRFYKKLHFGRKLFRTIFT
jgi:hypothetical protein